MAAGAAEAGVANCKSVADRHALIEDEAFALPQARLRRDRLQVFEDAAFEVIDLREALREHVS